MNGTETMSHAPEGRRRLPAPMFLFGGVCIEADDTALSLEIENGGTLRAQATTSARVRTREEGEGQLASRKLSTWNEFLAS